MLPSTYLTSTRLEAGSIIAAIGTNCLRHADAARGRSVIDVEDALRVENVAALRATELVEVGLEFERTFGLVGWRGRLPKLAAMARETALASETEALSC